MITTDITTQHGPMRVPLEDVWVGECLRTHGVHSPGELSMMQLVLGLLSHGKYDSVVIEGGAYIGDHTIPLSRMCKRLYAFEPNPSIRELLQHNLAQNGCTNVEVMPYALGDVHKTLQIESVHIDPDGRPSPGGTQVGIGDITCEMVTLDDLDLHADLIKADIEGMEIPLLSGAMRILGDERPALFMEYDTVVQAGLRPLAECMELLGYEPYPMAFPLAPGAQDRFGTTVSKMMLGVREPQRA